MAATELALERPRSADGVASVLAQGHVVRPVGGRTKLAWGAPGAAPEVELSTERLDKLVEHSRGDMTAVLQAGVRLRDAQKVFRKADQRLALDPPDGDGHATIGGIVATGDSGPLRHRYGGVRDLILGIEVALADGSVARAGSRVIKNVAGYDLAKLMCGALGTLGVVCEVIMRLHPKPPRTVTAVGRSNQAGRLARATAAVAREPLEPETLDVSWDGEDGAVLVQAGGHAADEAAEAIARVLVREGLDTELIERDAELWDAQRARQRARDPEGAIVRVSFPPAELERVLMAAPSAVARGGAGLAWIPIHPDPESLQGLRSALAPCPCVLLDGPQSLRAATDPWGMAEGPALVLMERVKSRFDPDGICNRGRFVGGL